jgi:hypothetical protein
MPLVKVWLGLLLGGFDTLKLLHNPSKRGLECGPFALVKHRLLLLLKGLPELTFSQRIHQQRQRHNQGQSFDPLRLFDEDAAGKEQWVLEEAEATLNLLLLLVLLQQPLSRPLLLI